MNRAEQQQRMEVFREGVLAAFKHANLSKVGISFCMASYVYIELGTRLFLSHLGVVRGAELAQRAVAIVVDDFEGGVGANAELPTTTLPFGEFAGHIRTLRHRIVDVLEQHASDDAGVPAELAGFILIEIGTTACLDELGCARGGAIAKQHLHAVLALDESAIP